MAGKEKTAKSNTPRANPYPPKKPQTKPKPSPSSNNELDAEKAASALAAALAEERALQAQIGAKVTAFKDFVKNSEFSKIEKLSADVTLGNLSNPIHPIFHRRNFFNINDQAYEQVLTPSLRLASLLITHSAVKPLFRSILLHSDLVSLTERIANEPLWSYSAADSDFNTEVTQEDSDYIDAALLELQEFVSFVSDPTKPMGFASTNDDSELPGAGGARLLTEGSLSWTYYSAQALDMLATATAQIGTPQEDVPALLAWRFHLAVELAHEVAHVLVNAKAGRQPHHVTETFFHGALVSEIGFSLEQALFGGHVALLWNRTLEFGDAPDQKVDIRVHRTAAPAGTGKGKGIASAQDRTSRLQGFVVMWDWPCRWICEDYQVQKLGCWIRQQLPKRLKRKDVAWRVPVSDLAKYFDMGFWASTGHGARELLVRKRTGQLFEQKRTEGVIGIWPWRSPFLLPEKLRTDGLYVPQGYEVVGEHSDIVKIVKR